MPQNRVRLVRILLSLSLVLVCLFAFERGVAASTGTEEKMMTVVYVYDGNVTRYRDQDADRIDQMFYSFATFRGGHVSVAHWKNIRKFQKFIGKQPTIMPILSVGGWGADGFSQAAATADGRETLVNDVLSILRQYGFRGVDIDWEYPGSSDAGIQSSPEDRENYTRLLRALRDGLDGLAAEEGQPYRLCVALSASPYLIPNLECEKIGEIVDQVNLMTYDQQQQDVASHHSAVFASAPGVLCAADGIQAYIQAGIPARKLMLGVAFYGHRWATKIAQPLYQPATYKGTMTYTAIAKWLKKKPNAVLFDAVAQAPYYFDGKTFISYDDERSIASKRAYVAETGLMGLFAWEYGGDTTGALVRAMR